MQEGCAGVYISPQNTSVLTAPYMAPVLIRLVPRCWRIVAGRDCAYIASAVLQNSRQIGNRSCTSSTLRRHSLHPQAVACAYRCSKAWTRCASDQACTLAAPGRKAYTISSGRLWTTPSMRCKEAMRPLWMCAWTSTRAQCLSATTAEASQRSCTQPQASPP